MTDEPNATIQEAIAAGWCVSGIRDWSARNGIAMRDLVRNGVPIGTIRAAGDDAFADLILERRATGSEPTGE